MDVTFTINDETVVTSNTVKVIATITGQAGSDTREQHEARARKLATDFLDEEWAYHNFAYDAQGMTFSVGITCRIPAEANNEGLYEKAKKLSDRLTSLSIRNLDLSVPARDMAEGESRLRRRMLETATEAALAMGDFAVTQVDFEEGYKGGAKGMMQATYAAEAAPGSAVGHSEKISLTAKIKVSGETGFTPGSGGK